MGGEMMIELTHRRYRCPDSCGLDCIIEVNSTRVIDDWECPGNRGHIYDWILLDEQEGGERQ